MNPDVRELYQQIIIDHGQHPRHFGKLEPCTHHLEGYNPLCGDRLTLYLKLNQQRIEAIQFEGVGCAISMASASLMSEALQGKTLAESEAMFQQFHQMLTQPTNPQAPASLGKLTILAGVKEFPMRVKCATLAWHTLHALLHGEHERVSTEASSPL